MPFTEDLTAFLQTGDFAFAATYTPASGSPVTVNVIFDEADTGRLGIAATNPVARGRASDFSDVAIGGNDQLVINSVTYRIKDITPLDDGAMVELQLETQ